MKKMSISKQKYLLFDKHFIVLTLLILGAVGIVSVAGQKTQTQQQASEPVDLNSAAEIDSTINPDRTMGPKTSQGNFSNSLPNTYLGNVEVGVVGLDDSDVLSLTLVISKAEVHLVRLFMPGASDNTPTEGINGRRTNQNVNKWETLQLSRNTYNPVALRLEKGLVDSFGNTALAGGKYSEIRLYVSKATARLNSGKEVELVLPGGESIIRVVRAFNIFSNKPTNLALELNIKSSIIQEGDTYFLKPVISRITVGN